MTDTESPAVRVNRSIAAKQATRPEIDNQGRIVGEPTTWEYDAAGRLVGEVKG